MFNLSELPKEEREKCAVCDRQVAGAAEFVSVVSGVMSNIGQGKDKKDLFCKEPTLQHTAPVCYECSESGVNKIKKRRLLNCILSILCWPIGIALTIAGIVFGLSGEIGIQIGDYIITPYIFVAIICIPGIIVLLLAVHTGKRGFSNPIRLFLSDTEGKLKSKILDEVKEKCGGSAFTATMKEASALPLQNANAQKLCKYPAQSADNLN